MEPNEQLAVIIPMLREVAGRITAAQLPGPTPCTEFTVEAVLDHMTQLATGFAPMFRGEDPAAAGTVALGSDPVEAFDAAMAELLAAVQSPGALDRTIQTPGGQMPGEAFARLVALDGVVHGWDLATSTSQDWAPPEGLVAEIDAFARAAISPEMRTGAFGAERTASGAGPMDQLAAFTGRVA